MRHLTLTLVALLVTATGLAQEVFFESKIDPITDLNTSGVGFSTVDYDRWDENSGGVFVRCAGDDGYEVFVGSTGYLGTGDDIAVVYRFDSQAPVSTSWGSSTDGTAVFVPWREREGILRQLLSSSRFVLRVTRYDDTTRTLIFDVPSDLREYVLRLGCVTPN